MTWKGLAYTILILLAFGLFFSAIQPEQEEHQELPLWVWIVDILGGIIIIIGAIGFYNYKTSFGNSNR